MHPSVNEVVISFQQRVGNSSQCFRLTVNNTTLVVNYNKGIIQDIDFAMDIHHPQKKEKCFILN